MPSEPLYVMTPTEIGWGYLVGHEGSSAAPGGRPGVPRSVLEQVILPALERPPCGVAFSGGRDSSFVLAVATDLARRTGLAEPIPITRRFPDSPETDETEWQEYVIRHLGLRDWERIELRDEVDVVGPIARRHLLEHGVLWPPSIASDTPLVDAVAGGSLLDGEGGDEVLGIEVHRIAPLNRLIRHPRPLHRWRIRRALGVLAPSRLRVPRVRRRREGSVQAWLQPAAWDAFMDALDASESSQPLSYKSSVAMIPRRRSQVLAGRNRQILAARRDVVLRSPLLDPAFVAALGADGGWLGRGERTTVLRALAADLLPDRLLARTSKSSFNTAYMGAHTRAFAEQWDGTGLDQDLADAETLRTLWLSNKPPGPTSSLLQAAWLASTDRSTDSDSRHD